MRWRIGKNGLGMWATYHPWYGLALFASWEDARDSLRERLGTAWGAS